MSLDIISLLIGWLSGVLLFAMINITRQSGYIRIDRSNPEKDYYLIDISKDLDKIPGKKKIILKVDSKYKKPQ